MAATSSWMLQPGISTDDRTARGYASLFQTVEQNKSRMQNASEIRERLVTIVIDGGGRIQRRVSNGVTSVEVGTVRVGRAHAKTAFKYQARLQQQIPSISEMYSGMSAMIHGEDSAMGLAWDGPDVMMRMVAKVTLESTRAWSTAVHTWTGVELQLSFVNAEDERNIIRSMPAEQLALFEAERQHR